MIQMEQQMRKHARRAVIRANLADMGFERSVNWADKSAVSTQANRGEYGGDHTTQVRGDVVALGAGSAAAVPLAGKAEIVRRLPANVIVAEVGIENLWVGKGTRAVLPLAEVGCRRRVGGR